MSKVNEDNLVRRRRGDHDILWFEVAQDDATIIDFVYTLHCRDVLEVIG